MRIKLKELKRLIRERLEEYEGSSFGDDSDKIYEAVKAQAELIADEVLHVWVELYKTQPGLADNETIWMRQAEKAADILKSELPIDTIMTAIDEIEKRLMNGEFK